MRHQKLTIAAVFFGFTLVAHTTLNAQYAINLLAGGGPNGLPATASSIGNPGGVARDGSGNTYIVDALSSRVFKVDPSGALTLFAGNGSLLGVGGYSGDGGPATSASLARPEGVAVDAAGNVFIADTDNSVVRCVVASAGGCFGSTFPAGSITTVAGVFYPASSECIDSGDDGPATSAQLCQPGGVSLDPQGNLFIADTGNSVVREVVAASGTIQTVAGSVTLGPGYSGDGAAATSAQLDLPGGVSVDGAGNILIADTFNSVIREVVAATGFIQTVAGTYYAFDLACNFSGDGGLASAAQLCLPGGVAVDGAGDIFIADTFNSEIREVAGGNIQVFAGIGGSAGYAGDGGAATSAQVNDPNGLFVDVAGNVFIADTENFVVREVSAGIIQPLAGNRTAAYSGDGATAANASLYAPGATFVDGAGNVFIADTYNCVVREVLAPNGTIQTVAGNGTCGYSGDGATATSAQLNYPGGIFLDSVGDIFIADGENSVIREVVAATGDIQTVAGNGTAGYLGDGAAATSAELSAPSSVFVNAAGDIFIADTGNSAIRCVVGAANGCFGSTLAAGSITTVAGTGVPCNTPAGSCGDGAAATSAQLNFPGGVFGDSLGNIFIADTFDSKIREVAAATGTIQTVAGTGVTGYSGDGALATSALLFDPYGLFVDSLGNIFIADTFNSVVREVVAVTGNIQTAAGDGTEGYAGDGGAGTSAELANPLGIVGDTSGNLFVADTENSRIRKLTSTVSITSIPTSAALPTSGSQQFAATVTGATDTSVTWLVNGVIGGNATVGTINALGSYVAPAAVPTTPTVTVTAIANANGVSAASAPVTIVSGSTTLTLTLSTSPTVTEVYTSAAQTFVATVTGSTNTDVNWLVNGVAGGNATVGTIAAGVYTAPAAVPSPATVVIGAVSQADSTVSASYPITIVTAPTASQPAGQSISSGGTASYSISLNANTGNPKQAITLSCLTSTLPSGATCTFTPATITPGVAAVPFTLAIHVPPSAAMSRYERTGTPLGMFAAVLPMVGILVAGIDRRKRRSWLLALALACGSLVLLVGCGGNSSGGHVIQNPQTYNVQVQVTTAAQPNPTTLTTVSLTVQ